MFTVTFYSFKGGVGRTLALMNVAAELAKTGNTVAVLDFDLEAPGLDTFDCFTPEPRAGSWRSRESIVPKFGLLDFIKKYSDSYNSDTPEIPDLRDYMGKAYKEAFTSFVQKRERFTPSTRTGNVWLMPAKGKASKAELSQIRFKDLYENKEGYLLFEELKLRIKKHTGADYLLVDSRTGYADHSYICTNQLADALVAVFFPNIQNQKGLKEIIDKVRGANKVDDKNILFVASRIPTGDDENNVLSKRIEKFADELQIEVSSILRLHHNTSFELLDQSLFSLDKTGNTQLFRDYVHLTDKIEMLNPASRRGMMLSLREAAEIRFSYDSRIARRRQIPTIPLAQDFVPSRRLRDTFLLAGDIAIRFVNDVALNTELASFFESNRGRGTNRSFLFRLNAFFLHKKPISGLSFDPTDPFDIIEAFVASPLEIDEINEKLFAQAWSFDAVPDSRLMRKGDLPTYARRNLKHGRKTVGELMDTILASAMSKIPNRIQEKKSGIIHSLEIRKMLFAIFLNHRHVKFTFGEANKAVVFSEIEKDVLSMLPRARVFYALRQTYAGYQLSSSNKFVEPYEACRSALTWFYHDFATVDEMENHSLILKDIGTKAFKTWTSESLAIHFEHQIRRPNRFLSIYLPMIVKLFQSEEELQEETQEEELDELFRAPFNLPPNQFAALCAIVKVYDLDLTLEDDEEDNTDFKFDGINRYIEFRNRNAEKTTQLQKRLDELTARAKDLESERLQDLYDEHGNEIKDYEHELNFEQNQKEIDFVQAELAPLVRETSTFSKYFSFLKMSQVDVVEIFDELEFVKDSTQYELINFIRDNLYNKNNIE